MQLIEKIMNTYDIIPDHVRPYVVTCINEALNILGIKIDDDDKVS